MQIIFLHTFLHIFLRIFIIRKAYNGYQKKMYMNQLFDQNQLNRPN